MKVTHPYQIVQQRIDVVVRVPAWASDVFAKGDQVIRESSETVNINGRRYRLGESYTKFFGYTWQVDGFLFWLYNTYTTEQTMNYKLITATGKLYTFFVQAVAETYQQAYGGVIVTDEILVDTTSQTVYN